MTGAFLRLSGTSWFTSLISGIIRKNDVFLILCHNSRIDYTTGTGLIKSQERFEGRRVARGRKTGGFPDFAASRAYYGMCYIAEALLAHLGQSYSSHSAVITAFGREFAKTAKMDPVFYRSAVNGYKEKQAEYLARP